MHRLMDATLTYATFPIVFGGAMAIAIMGIQSGWDPVFTAMGLTGAVVLALLVLERVHPYHEPWLHSHGDIRTDLIHNLVTSGFRRSTPSSSSARLPPRVGGSRLALVRAFGPRNGRSSRSCSLRW
jgi:hypothetical protein